MKTNYVILALALSFSLFACASGEQGDKPSDTKEEQKQDNQAKDPEGEPIYRIGQEPSQKGEIRYATGTVRKMEAASTQEGFNFEIRGQNIMLGLIIEKDLGKDIIGKEVTVKYLNFVKDTNFIALRLADETNAEALATIKDLDQGFKGFVEKSMEAAKVQIKGIVERHEVKDFDKIVFLQGQSQGFKGGKDFDVDNPRYKGKEVVLLGDERKESLMLAIWLKK